MLNLIKGVDWSVDEIKMEQNGSHFADDILNAFSRKKKLILSQILHKSVHWV